MRYEPLWWWVVILACTYTNVLWIELCRTQIVHDLIRGEKAERVGEVLEVLHNAENAREIILVVARPWLGTVDALASQR